MATQAEKDAATALLDGVREGHNEPLVPFNAALALVQQQSVIDLGPLRDAVFGAVEHVQAIRAPYLAARAAVAALPIEPSTDPIIVVFGVEAA